MNTKLFDTVGFAALKQATTLDEARDILLRKLAEIDAEQGAEEDEAGVPEYASVTIIIDHLLSEHSADAPVVKHVYGFEDAAGALLTQARYFNDLDTLVDRKVITTLTQATGNDVFVYKPGNEYGLRQVQVIMDIERYRFLLTHPTLGIGSLLLTDQCAISIASGALDAMKQFGSNVVLAAEPEMAEAEAAA